MESSPEDCLDIIRDSEINQDFLIRALEQIGGLEPRRYIEALSPSLDSLIQGCIQTHNGGVDGEGDVSDWMRPAPDIGYCLGSPPKLEENLAKLVKILEENAYSKSEYSNIIHENLMRNYLGQ